METLREPQEYTTSDGEKYKISKFDCLTGREIMLQYPVSNLPKLGEYEISQQMALKSMSFVEHEINGRWVRLENPGLVKQHIKSWESLVELEKAMIVYNFSFFQNGAVFDFLKNLGTTLEGQVTKILTQLLDSWLQTKSRRSGNSVLTTPSKRQ